MYPAIALLLYLTLAAVSVLLLWFIIRSAVEWGIIRAAHRMRRDGYTLPVSTASRTNNRPAAKS